MMHDESLAGVATRARALAYWQSIDAALERAQAAQNRSRAYLLIRAGVRAAVSVLAGLAGILGVYCVGIIAAAFSG